MYRGVPRVDQPIFAVMEVDGRGSVGGWHESLDNGTLWGRHNVYKSAFPLMLNTRTTSLRGDETYYKS